MKKVLASYFLVREGGFSQKYVHTQNIQRLIETRRINRLTLFFIFLIFVKVKKKRRSTCPVKNITDYIHLEYE